MCRHMLHALCTQLHMSAGERVAFYSEGVKIQRGQRLAWGHTNRIEVAPLGRQPTHPRQGWVGEGVSAGQTGPLQRCGCLSSIDLGQSPLSVLDTELGQLALDGSEEPSASFHLGRPERGAVIIKIAALS